MKQILPGGNGNDGGRDKSSTRTEPGPGVQPQDQTFVIDGQEVRQSPVQFSLETATASVKPATATEDLDHIVDRANEEQASRFLPLSE